MNRIKYIFITLIFSLLFASCSMLEREREDGASVSFKLDSETVQKIKDAAGEASSVSNARSAEGESIFVEVAVHGGYEKSTTVQVQTEATISIDSIPMESEIYLEATAYINVDGERQNLYKGHSKKFVVRNSENLVMFILYRVGDGEDSEGGSGSGSGGSGSGTGGGGTGGGGNGSGGNGSSGSGGSGGGGSGGSSNPQGQTYGEYIQMPFSVSADKQVYFSPGNLWYQASSSTFKFAENQYDIVGKDANEEAFTAFISENPTSYTGWTDLFEWGSSGAGIAGIEYPPYTRKFPNGLQNALHVPEMTGDYAELDWGVHNAISNGGNQAGQWRTLTWPEWNYLLNSRSGAPSKRAPARVNGIAGMIIFPDTWTPASMPSGITLNYTNTNNSSDYYGTNIYTALQWSQLEALGAVFLPATGTCYEGVSSSATTPNWDGVDGSSTSGTIYVSYYTATAYSGDTKYRIYTSNGGYNKESIDKSNPSADTPVAVRLTQDRTDYYEVPSVNPSQLYVSPTGTETGDGSESNPLDTIAHAVTKIKSFSEAQDYTIFIDGTLNQVQELKNITKPYAKSITVKGKNGINESTHEPNDSIAGDLSSSTRMLKIITTVPVIVKDLKITGGYDTGGGVCIGDGNQSTIACDVTLSSGTLITGNKSSGNGAGVNVYRDSKLTIDGAVISGNIGSSSSESLGIGVYSNGKELIITGNSKITGNTSTSTSGNYSAVACVKYDSSDTVIATIEGNAEIIDNEVRGLYIKSVPITLKGNCKINGNQNQSTSSSNGGYYGGGIYAAASNAYEISISDNTEISGNSAKNAGGLYISNTAITVNFSGGSISDNTLTDSSGKAKGVYLWMGNSAIEDRFIMSGTAVIASNNDIYLAGNYARITAGSLTPPSGVTTVATITPYNNEYSDSIQVLNGSLDGAYQLFAVTPDSSTSPSTPWYVSSTGYLTDTQP